jgi:hypothetical protein
MNELYQRRKLAEGIKVFHDRWPHVASSSEDAPIFILSAGWRSGSTLLQRMLTTECLIWGEPYGHAWMIDSLAEPIRSITDSWPEPPFFYQGQDWKTLRESFVANLYPQPEHLLNAHLQYFDTMFAKPARAAGARRWGIKEARLTADHGAYLKWLYPRAKIIFVIRNPYDAYRSYAARRAAGWVWYNRWPEHPLTTREFARHWRILTSGFIEQAKSLDALLVSYEDLARGEFDAIRSYLAMEIAEEATAIRPEDGPPPLDEIPAGELAEFQEEVGELASSLGYHYKSEPEPRAPIGSQPAAPTDNSRCVVLVPVAGHIEPACEAGLQELERRGYCVRRVRGYSAIDQGRNQMATDALADGFEETMWIDSDVGFQPDDVDRLRSHRLPVVCGIYPKKGQRELACHVLPGTQKLVFGQEGGLAEILYAATGFLLVHRDAYGQIRRDLRLPSCNDRWGRPMVPFFQPLVLPHLDGYWYLAEDYAFCQRARQCGLKIFADTRIRLTHYGSYGYSWEEAGIDPQRYSVFHYHLSGAEPVLEDNHVRSDARLAVPEPVACP